MREGVRKEAKRNRKSKSCFTIKERFLERGAKALGEFI